MCEVAQCDFLNLFRFIIYLLDVQSFEVKVYTTV